MLIISHKGYYITVSCLCAWGARRIWTQCGPDPAGREYILFVWMFIWAAILTVMWAHSLYAITLWLDLEVKRVSRSEFMDVCQLLKSDTGALIPSDCNGNRQLALLEKHVIEDVSICPPESVTPLVKVFDTWVAQLKTMREVRATVDQLLRGYPEDARVSTWSRWGGCANIFVRDLEHGLNTLKKHPVFERQMIMANAIQTTDNTKRAADSAREAATYAAMNFWLKK
jgi:hypothetical protein